jgi:archaeosortase A
MKEKLSSEDYQSSLFIILPILYIILAFTIFTYPLNPLIIAFLPIPLFLGLIFLIMGSFLKNQRNGSRIRMIGWMVFSAYWATQPQTLYFAEQQDLINALICIIGIFVLCYFAYREWFSLKTDDYEASLQWIAGASALAGFIYFLFELTPLSTILIDIVAVQSGLLLNLFTGEVIVNPPFLAYKTAYIRIIFACTAVQSMVIFIGMILPLPNVELKRKVQGILITVVPVYFLNLIRNALITYLVGIYGNDFFSIAHNYIGKGGSLLALIVILFFVVKYVPEVFDHILALTDLPKKQGPIERMLSKILRRNS